MATGADIVRGIVRAGGGGDDDELAKSDVEGTVEVRGMGRATGADFVLGVADDGPAEFERVDSAWALSATKERCRLGSSVVLFLASSCSAFKSSIVKRFEDEIDAKGLD